MDSGLHTGINLLKSFVDPSLRGNAITKFRDPLQADAVSDLFVSEYDRAGKAYETTASPTLKSANEYFKMAIAALAASRTESDYFLVSKRFEACEGKAVEAIVNSKDLIEKILATKYQILCILYLDSYFQRVSQPNVNDDLAQTISRIRNCWKELVKSDDIMHYVASDAKLLRSSVRGNLQNIQNDQKMKREIVFQLTEMSLVLNVYFGKEFRINYDTHKYLTRLEEWIVKANAYDGNVDSQTGSSRKVKPKRRVDENICAMTTYNKKYLITGSETIRVYDISSQSSAPMLVTTFDGHKSVVRSLVVFGDRLFSGSNDNSIKVWDLQCLSTVQLSSSRSFELNANLSADAIVATLNAHKGNVHTLASSNQKLFSISNDDTIKLWDYSKPTYPQGPPSMISSLGFHGEWILSWAVQNDFIFGSTVENVVKIWSLSSNFKSYSLLTSIDGYESAVRTILPVGKTLYTYAGEILRVWDISTISRPQILKEEVLSDVICSIAVSGGRMYAGICDDSIYVWEISESGTSKQNKNERRQRSFDLQHIMTFSGHLSLVQSLFVVDDRLFSGSKDGVIKAWGVIVLPCFTDVNLPRGYYLSEEISISTDVIASVAPQYLKPVEDVPETIETQSVHEISISNDSPYDESPAIVQPVLAVAPVWYDVDDDDQKRDTEVSDAEPTEVNDIAITVDPEPVAAPRPVFKPEPIAPSKSFKTFHIETLAEKIARLKREQQEPPISHHSTIGSESDNEYHTPDGSSVVSPAKPEIQFKTVTTRSVADTVAKIAKLSEEQGYRSSKSDIIELIKKRKEAKQATILEEEESFDLTDDVVITIEEEDDEDLVDSPPESDTHIVAIEQ